MNLLEYRAIARDHAPPSDAQIESFAEHVSGAHSWYKHLPPLSPGIRFHFYIDPHAGYDLLQQDDGQVRPMLRTEKSRVLHYSSMPTIQYRDRFGCLAYVCVYGTRVADVTSAGVLRLANQREAIIYDRDGQPHQLPEEALEAGSVELTAVIHRFSATELPWMRLMRAGTPRLTWPAETGGPGTLERILSRCREMGQIPHLERPDPILSELLAPERGRLLKEMAIAMGRMRDVVWA